MSPPSANIGSMGPDQFTPADLATQAGRCGLVTQRELAAGSVGVHGPLGHRGPADRGATYAVTAGRRPVGYVKVAPGAADRLDRERAVLTALADRDCVPEVVDGSGGAQLWTSVAGETAIGDVRGSISDLLEVCHAWGAALGRLHTTAIRPLRTGARRPPRAQPWVLDRRALSRSLVHGQRGPATDRRRRILATLEDRTELRAAAAEVAERWTAQHWVHGDLRLEQVLLSTAGGRRVRFVGLGDAGLGDPAWDLAAAYDGLHAQAAVWSLQPSLAVEYFLLGYRHTGGPARLYPAIQAVHALATAWHLAETDPAPAVDAWVGRACGYAATSQRGWLAAA